MTEPSESRKINFKKILTPNGVLHGSPEHLENLRQIDFTKVHYVVSVSAPTPPNIFEVNDQKYIVIPRTHNVKDYRDLMKTREKEAKEIEENIANAFDKFGRLHAEDTLARKGQLFVNVPLELSIAHFELNAHTRLQGLKSVVNPVGYFKPKKQPSKRTQAYFIYPYHADFQNAGEYLSEIYSAHLTNRQKEIRKVKLMRLMGRAIREVHDRGVVHGDLDRVNFLVKTNKNNEPTEVKIIDFAHTHLGRKGPWNSLRAKIQEVETPLSQRDYERRLEARLEVEWPGNIRAAKIKALHLQNNHVAALEETKKSLLEIARRVSRPPFFQNDLLKLLTLPLYITKDGETVKYPVSTKEKIALLTSYAPELMHRIQRRRKK